MSSSEHRELTELVVSGRFDRAVNLAERLRSPSVKEIKAAADVIGAASWLAEHAPTEIVRGEAERVMEAIRRVSFQWDRHARPLPLAKERIPRDKAQFDRLMMTTVGTGGFYHPVRAPCFEPPPAARRWNARSRSDRYHLLEWTFVERCLRRHLGGSLEGRVIIDLGPAEGFFTLALARAGARVLAIEKSLLMALRTAVMSALWGVERRVVVKFADALAIADVIDHTQRTCPGYDRVDAICALGVIYHFDDLVGGLSTLTATRCPILFEFRATNRSEEVSFDPGTHDDRRPVSRVWLAEWLEGQGFSTHPVPDWVTASARLREDRRLLNEMLMAVPRP